MENRKLTAKAYLSPKNVLREAQPQHLRLKDKLRANCKTWTPSWISDVSTCALASARIHLQYFRELALPTSGGNRHAHATWRQSWCNFFARALSVEFLIFLASLLNVTIFEIALFLLLFVPATNADKKTLWRRIYVLPSTIFSIDDDTYTGVMQFCVKSVLKIDHETLLKWGLLKCTWLSPRQPH